VKTDRLLSIIIFLLGHDVVSTSKLADRFNVSRRTIQRDMEAIELAGIPLYAIQGPKGGYGIMDAYKMDRQLMNTEDLYHIVTALERIAETLCDSSIQGTLEKVRSMVAKREFDFFSERNEKLSIDFSMLGGDPRKRDTFRIIKKAVETERLLTFVYTSNKLETVKRCVEPMTIAFRWRSWYLYAYCRLRNDYRLFSITKIKEARIEEQRFRRREKRYADFLEESRGSGTERNVELVLRFSHEMAHLVADYYPERDCKSLPGGGLEVKTTMPEDGWVYGHILSFGPFVEVLAPSHIRNRIARSADAIKNLYSET